MSRTASHACIASGASSAVAHSCGTAAARAARTQHRKAAHLCGRKLFRRRVMPGAEALDHAFPFPFWQPHTSSGSARCTILNFGFAGGSPHSRTLCETSRPHNEQVPTYLRYHHFAFFRCPTGGALLRGFFTSFLPRAPSYPTHARGKSRTIRSSSASGTSA